MQSRARSGDLATKINGKLQTLIEVKAFGIELKDWQVKQAVDYAANQGVDWVLLTNGLLWRVQGYFCQAHQPRIGQPHRLRRDEPEVNLRSRIALSVVQRRLGKIRAGQVRRTEGSA
jgi:predicted type IV restriction endonuclease